MIPIEIFESLEICAYIHRFLFEFNKYIHKRSPSLNVYIPYHTINIYVSDELAAWQILLMTTGKKQKKQQSTMSEITHQNDDNGNDEFNYSHDSCPTCQDRLIVESYVEGCEDRIFCECCDFCCPECQCRWHEVKELVEKFLEGESILTRLKDEDITASRARNLLYKFLIRVFSGPLGKGVRMQLPDCCLKGVRSLLKNKDPNEVFTGFKPTSKRSKCSKSIND